MAVTACKQIASPSGTALALEGIRRGHRRPRTTRQRCRDRDQPRLSKGDGMAEYSRRGFLKGSLAAGTALGAGLGFRNVLTAQETVKIGVLHSLSGTMAISEVSLRDVVLMAVEEINAKGGVMGKKISPVVVDPASNWDLFAEKAKQLLLKDKVAVVFGCWTSVSRKSVLPVFENNNGLLFYPVQYEGEECSKNVFYTGATPNQQLIPGAEYLMSKEGGAYKKFYLLGTDYVFPRTANKILRPFLLAKGMPARNMEEGYLGVYIWKQAVEKAKTFDVDPVRKAVYGQTFAAPSGTIKMHEHNHHTYRPVLIGEILKDGQFKIISRTKGLVEPEPWSKYTSPDKGCDWVKHQGTYQKKA